MSVDGNEDPSVIETVRLVRAAQGGDRRAEEALLARYLPRVRRIVALRMGRRLGELLDEEDVVQEALLKAWRGLGSFEHRGEASFLHWIARIVENELRMAARHHGTRKRDARPMPIGSGESSGMLSESVLGGTVPTPSAIARGAELEESLETLLLSMDEGDREVVVLSRLCGMPAAEVARELGLGTASSARARLSRVLARLAENLLS